MKIYFAASNDQFLKPIISVLQANGVECIVEQVFNKFNSIGSDIIWCEWGDDNALALQEFVTPAKKILRIHRYEAYNEDLWKVMNPEAFDTIIFVADHIKKEVEHRVGYELTNAVVVRNVLDIEKHQIAKDKQPNNKIAHAGYLCRKKGIGELLLIASSLPDYEFHIAGIPQENDFLAYFNDRKPDNVFLYAWQDDLNEFFADKTYIIGTALSESAHISVMEGMLCGLVPMQRNWEGSEDIYPAENIWSSIQDIMQILMRKPDFEKNREYIIKSFNPDEVFRQLSEIFNKPKRNQYRPETLTVAVVQTREKYLKELMHSLSLQYREIQDFEVKVLSNFDKDMTIGKAFNKLADECTTDWILYVGDDDVLEEDYIDSIFRKYYHRQGMFKNVVGLITGCLIWDGNVNASPTTHFPTGCWKADFIRKYRFDETLVRQVDTEFIERVNGTNDGIVLQMSSNMGYFYRQHAKNISGNKITEGAIMHQNPVEETNATGK